jgi:hypothetical protein
MERIDDAYIVSRMRAEAKQYHNIGREILANCLRVRVDENTVQLVKNGR